MRYEAAIKYIFFLALFLIANDSQLFFLMDTCSFLGLGPYSPTPFKVNWRLKCFVTSVPVVVTMLSYNLTYS
jgi:hypothetical protein